MPRISNGSQFSRAPFENNSIAEHVTPHLLTDFTVSRFLLQFHVDNVLAVIAQAAFS